ncbi:hypothetical protein [Streptomyces sp. NPDC058266]|uniref:hypothetical protein n=1 Tax=Streptomyces sp. NPDC058266 TaxID=3346412 RepID=UPI0036DFE308
MKFRSKIAAIGVAATTVVLFNVSGAQAQDGGDGLLPILNGTPITLACFPVGQVGQGNQFEGTQNINCGQSSAAPAEGGNGGGVTGAQVVEDGGTHVPGDQFGTDEVHCPAGKVATGGGFTTTGYFNEMQSQPSPPTGQPTGWSAAGRADSAGGTIYAWAVCADAG